MATREVARLRAELALHRAAIDYARTEISEPPTDDELGRLSASASALHEAALKYADETRA